MDGKIDLKFEGTPTTSIMEFSLFIQYFLSTYRALYYQRINEETIMEIQKNNCLLDKLATPLLRKCLSNEPLPNDPKIISIIQQSPLIITICGCVSCLTMAAILSGGSQQIKLGPLDIKFNLTSLGESLQKLRQNFSHNKAFQPKYGFSGIKIKLNSNEYEELLSRF